MHRHLPLFALGLICATPAVAFDLPARKAGLWEQKMVTEGMDAPDQVTQICIDEATDKKFNALSGAMMNGMCSKQDFKESGGTIVFDSVCQIGPIKSSSHGEITGDFDSTYTVKMTSKQESTPGLPPVPGMEAQKNMTIEAKWISPCQADQKPGDMIMADGTKMNIGDMQSMMQNMQSMTRQAPGAMPQQ